MEHLIYLLPAIAVIAAIHIRCEMVIWYAAVTLTGTLIMIADPVAWKALVIFCVLNSLSMTVAYKHWNETFVDVAFYMGALYAVEVILSFAHVTHYSMTGELLNSIGAATGIIGFVELILVSRMHDRQGALCELFNDISGCCLRCIGRSRDG